MAVILGSIAPATTITDDATLQLEGAYGVHVLTVGERTFVYAAGRTDDGISSFELGSDGSLTSIENISDDANLELNGAANFASVTLGNTTYLYVNGSNDDGISAFQVNADGTLTSIQNIDDAADPALELLGTQGKMSVVTVGNNSFLIASGREDNGLSVFQINANGTLSLTDSETDAGDLELRDARDTATATIAGRTFVFVTGNDDNGVSVFELASDGTLTNTSNVSDDATTNLAGALGVTTATVGGTTYLVASGEDEGLSVFSVSDSGQLANVFNVADTAELRLGGAAGLTTFTLDGESFVAVSASDESAVSVFHIGAGGVLTDVTAVLDDAGLALGGTFYNDVANLGGSPILVATGSTDDGLSSLNVGGGNDTLTGTSDADVLLGLAGNDTLDGGAGDDRLIGGSGDDTYLVDSNGDVVVEQTDGGIDTVQASISTTLGANVENLLLGGTAALNGTGNELDNQITGNSGTNLLRGLSGRDTLAGLDGTDDLQGGRGNDRLAGGRGADSLLGGQGRDVMEGNGGADDFVFTRTNQSGTTRGTRDQILDFKGRDDLVLTRVDAVAGERGNQDFTFDTDGSFEAGEIRFREVARGVLVEMNTDADARAEMSVLLKGFTGVLNNNDFEV